MNVYISRLTFIKAILEKVVLVCWKTFFIDQPPVQFLSQKSVTSICEKDLKYTSPIYYKCQMHFNPHKLFFWISHNQKAYFIT